MKIALINENSQAAKNEMICNTLKSVVEPMGHTVFNYEGILESFVRGKQIFVFLFRVRPNIQPIITRNGQQSHEYRYDI